MFLMSTFYERERGLNIGYWKLFCSDYWKWWCWFSFRSCPSHICCRFFKLRPWNDEISDCAMLWVYINWYISMLLCLKISILDLIGLTTTIGFSLVLEKFQLLINGTPGLVWDRGVNLNGSNLIRHLLNISTVQI